MYSFFYEFFYKFKQEIKHNKKVLFFNILICLIGAIIGVVCALKFKINNCDAKYNCDLINLILHKESIFFFIIKKSMYVIIVMILIYINSLFNNTKCISSLCFGIICYYLFYNFVIFVKLWCLLGFIFYLIFALIFELIIIVLLIYFQLFCINNNMHFKDNIKFSFLLLFITLCVIIVMGILCWLFSIILCF